jgi:hypothetical protein
MEVPMAHPCYKVVQHGADDDAPYFTLFGMASYYEMLLEEGDKVVEVGTLPELIEWARVRKGGSWMIQQFLNDAVCLQDI